MDKDTLIESIRYRCHMRGETYGEFVMEYVTQAELETAAAADGHEGMMGRAMLALKKALVEIMEADYL